MQGTPGAIAVLHTHTRRLDYHPHVHLVMPAAAVNSEKKQWRTKRRSKGKGKGKGAYLFNHKALAKVFRAKLLSAIEAAGLRLPDRYPKDWVMDCKSVGSGEKALIYLGRYLYRGVIAEKDILACTASRAGQLPLSQRQDREAGTAHHVRRAVPVAGVAACAAQGIQACAQLRLSAPQLQTLDRLAASAAQVRSGLGSGVGQAARADSVRLLRCGDDDRANADSVGMLRGHANANCPRGGALTM